jgi:hypothetical protein
MLSAALVVFAMYRPAPAPAPIAPPAVMATVAAPPAVDVQALVDAAVAKAEERQAVKTAAIMVDLANAQKQLLWAAEELEQTQKRNAVRIAGLGIYGPPAENGEMR